MEYILEKVGMTDQMLRQLIMNNPESDTKYLLEEKILLNESLIDSFHDRGRNVHLLPENKDDELSVAPERAEGASNIFNKVVKVIDTNGLDENTIKLIEPTMFYSQNYVENETTFAVLHNSKGDIIRIFPERIEIQEDSVATEKNTFQLAIEQIELQEKVQREAGINIVCCGNCGQVLLHNVGDEEIKCVSCERVMALSDCPDLWYNGIENNYQ
jgi:hypothetical protein